MVNWNEVEPTNFEKFVHYALSKFGFTNREWHGRGGGDKGRDVVAKTFERLPFQLGYDRKWIFQCKKWKRFPSNHLILNEIATASQHRPDFWVLVIPLELTSSQIDYINHLNQNYDFKILTLALPEIEEIINSYPETRTILLNGSLLEGGNF